MLPDVHFNPALLSENRSSMGQRFIEELADFYFIHCESQLADLVAACAEGRARPIRDAAHKIRSSSLQVGFERLSAYAHLIEQAGLSGDIDLARNLLPELVAGIPPAHQHLREFVRAG